MCLRADVCACVSFTVPSSRCNSWLSVALISLRCRIEGLRLWKLSIVCFQCMVVCVRVSFVFFFLAPIKVLLADELAFLQPLRRSSLYTLSFRPPRRCESATSPTRTIVRTEADVCRCCWSCCSYGKWLYVQLIARSSRFLCLSQRRAACRRALSGRTSSSWPPPFAQCTVAGSPVAPSSPLG